jgi:hypothetical protein
MGKGGMGMDAGIGLLHVDAPSRDSLVLDIREPIRPKCDTFVLHWLQSEPLRKADFWEDRNGNCRLCSPLASKLYETADTWRRMLAPVAEFVAQELWFSRAPKCERRVLATRHTQRNKRIAKNSEVPIVNQLRPEHACEECGVKIPTDKKLCFKCWKKATPANFVKGRKLPHTPKSLARRAETQRKQRALNRAFDPATLPEWLTREFYVKQVIPALSNVPKRRIRRMLAVSEPHAARIAKGIVPHPRHWQALAQLVGLSC